jgi:hypothetical protein
MLFSKQKMLKWGGVVNFLLTLFSLNAQSSIALTEARDTCMIYREIGDPVVIHYQTYSRCFLPLGAQSDVMSATPIGFICSGDEMITNINVNTSEGLYDFVVPNDKSVQLVTTSSCGTNTVVLEFSSKSDYKGSLSVGPEFNSWATKWMNNPNGQDLYDMVVSCEYLDDIQKTQILQHVLNQDLPFPDAADNGLIPPKDALNKGNDCECTILEMRTTKFADPNVPCTQFPGFICSYEAPEDFSNSSGPVRFRARYRNAFEGPAKYMRLWGGYAGCGNALEQVDREKIGIAYLSFNMLCSDVEQKPADCRCTHELNVEYSYKSTLNAKSDIIGGLGACPFFNNRAAAYADDACVFLRIPDGQQIELGDTSGVLLDFARQAVTSDCSFDVLWDDKIEQLIDVYIEQFQFGLEIAELYGNYDSLNTNFDFSELSDYAEQFGNSISTYITSPWSESAGDCTDISRQLLIEGRDTFTLEFGKPINLALVTKARVYIAGSGAWRSDARIVSGYRMSGVIKGVPGEKDDPEGYCCTPAIASYLLGSMSHVFNNNTSPSIGELQTRVGNHISLIAGSDYDGILPFNPTTGGFIINNEAFTVIGKAEKDCKTIVIGGDRSSELESDADNTTLFRNGDSIMLVGSFPDGARYSVYDMQGKLVQSGDLVSNRINYPQSLSTGLYNIVVTDSKRILTSRTFSILK